MSSDGNTPLDDVHHRLQEAEATLNAIREGAVDAVVVDGPAGPQIYSLESPDQPFQVFVEQMQEGAITLNADGVIIYCNRFFSDMVGRPPTQVRGRSMREFVADPAQLQFETLRMSAFGGAAHGECLLQPVQGESLSVQLAFNRLPAANVDMFGVVITDLSERERAQQLEVARRIAEDANAARDQFLAVVSHELRTPLNAILGWTQLLRHRGEAASLERGLEVIERSARSQAQLIDDLLDVSRVLAGKLRLERQSVDLKRVVETALETVQTMAESKGIRLEHNLAVQPLVVFGDADRLQQIIWNLLNNAVKFTPARGLVRVTLHQIDSSACIEVADNGVGIPKAFLPRMFNFYQQIDGSTTRRSGGLGLGLAIVKQLTDLHGGEVYADSNGEGKGSTFSVKLPLYTVTTNEPVSVAKENEYSTALLAGVKLLVVEDEDDAREVLTHILESTGAEVRVASSAKNAVTILQTEQIDILISDIGMPDTDGYGLIQQIRNSGITGKMLPAIALTAFAGRDDRRQALLAGYQVHIPKPVDRTELCAAITNLADRSPS